MTYYDLFLAPVPSWNREKYLDFAKTMDPIFKEYGALSVTDCWGSDVPEGKVNSLHTAVLREEGEEVVFGFIKWESKAARDAGWEKAMADERMAGGEMPFDGKRMIFGGFDQIFEI